MIFRSPTEIVKNRINARTEHILQVCGKGWSSENYGKLYEICQTNSKGVLEDLPTIYRKLLLSKGFMFPAYAPIFDYGTIISFYSNFAAGIESKIHLLPTSSDYSILRTLSDLPRYLTPSYSTSVSSNDEVTACVDLKFPFSLSISIDRMEMYTKEIKSRKGHISSTKYYSLDITYIGKLVKLSEENISKIYSIHNSSLSQHKKIRYKPRIPIAVGMDSIHPFKGLIDLINLP